MSRRLLTVVALLFAACSGGDAPEQAPAPAASTGDLTAFQIEHGIGPITEPIELGEPDAALAAQGEASFKVKCTACHRIDERYIGPQLGDVLDRRSPTYVMNMMMNPTGMTDRHPVAKALLAEYMAPMPSQDLSREEARALLEYLRLADTTTTANGSD